MLCPKESGDVRVCSWCIVVHCVMFVYVIHSPGAADSHRGVCVDGGPRLHHRGRLGMERWIPVPVHSLGSRSVKSSMNTTALKPSQPLCIEYILSDDHLYLKFIFSTLLVKIRLSTKNTRFEYLPECVLHRYAKTNLSF